MNRDANIILLRPHITERSSLLSETGVYAFQVAPYATKADVAVAVLENYKLKVLSVRIVNLHGKKIIRGRTEGRSAGIKKAYVKVPKGSKIEFV
ncbi:MAG: 50S ribosomal protein L23 [Parcubacteria group bacterium RIFCSPHIGHO2_01_FULL_45_26]|nr:MAG: 50S ribosomal protein L23 [Parcubacteria group bacterium RIFCSPHIGHO2_01_FULL_45_26]